MVRRKDRKDGKKKDRMKDRIGEKGENCGNHL